MTLSSSSTTGSPLPHRPGGVPAVGPRDTGPATGGARRQSPVGVERAVGHRPDPPRGVRSERMRQGARPDVSAPVEVFMRGRFLKVCRLFALQRADQLSCTG